MARRPVRPTPSLAALTLIRWAADNDGYLDGRMTLAGVDLGSLDVARLCNVVYATWIEDAGAFADRAELREKLDEALSEPVADDESRWGMGKQAYEQQQAALAVLRGGG